MTLSGKTVWVALGSAFLVGVVGGSFATGWNKVRGLPPLEAGADAGVRVSFDAGVSAACDCVQEVKFITTEVPIYRTRYVSSDAGMVEIRTVETVPVLVPDIRLSGSSRAGAGADVLASAEATGGVRIQEGPVRRSGSVDLRATLDTAGRWGGDLTLGVRVLGDWWVVGGGQWTPGTSGHAALGVRREF